MAKASTPRRTRTKRPPAKAGTTSTSPGAPAPKPPPTPAALHRFLIEELGLTIPRRALLDTSTAPFDYLVHTFFEGRFDALGRDHGLDAPRTRPPADCVVWANRGGGKTFLGALATLLDLLFKPGIEVRILGGSLEQSSRMAEHLRRLCEHPLVRPRIARLTDRSVVFDTGSRASVLTHSQASVRGTRVQKVRCDEVELFDRDIWEAAQLTTRSLTTDGPWGSTVRGAVEALSTMHLPMGLMWDIVGGARRADEPDTQAAGDSAAPVAPAAPATRVLFRWGAIDVLERCGEQYACGTCELLPECQRHAKDPARDPGHLHVADALVHKARISTGAWESEMLCLRPTRGGTVLPEFDQRRHVFAGDSVALADLNSPLDGARAVAGMDFGYRAPTVIVWGTVSADNVLRITHEHHQAERRLEDHVAELSQPGRPRPEWIAVDPAGNQANDQTGATNVEMLRRAGWTIRTRRSGIHEGLELVRRRLEGIPAVRGRPGEAGALDRASPGLLIHARCTHLITAMHRYRYPPDQPESLAPIKDGHDHAVDALRYLIVALDALRPAKHGQYSGVGLRR